MLVYHRSHLLIRMYAQMHAHPPTTHIHAGEKYGHIAADKRGKISAACEELQKWLTEKVSEQAKVAGLTNTSMI